MSKNPTDNKPTWTKESVLSEALKYKTKTAFVNGNYSCYWAAKKNGWLDEALAHCPTPRKLSKETVVAEALKYKTKNEFFEGNASCYVKAKKMGWFEEVTAHMEVRTHRTKESLLEAAANYPSISELRKHDVNLYSTIAARKLLRDVHILFGVKRMTKEICFEFARLFDTPKDFKKFAPKAHAFSLCHGIYHEACAHMVKIRKKWSLEMLQAEAAKYKNKSEFRLGSNNAYRYARRYDHLSKLTFKS